ncbi:protein kinase [Anaerolineales bacterium HSG24]|nr:protein kinase [Anaerolineales bacterium HSG24]
MHETLKRYDIIEKIGQGGFATVYLAKDTQLNRLVALKVLKSTLFDNTERVKSFRREARTIAHLDHPHIVPIYDVVEVETELFLVMRLVDGAGLDVVIEKQGQIPWSEAVSIIQTVTQGLEYAHDKGVLHRDLKPSNILIDAERGPMLSDFGLAKLAGEYSMSVTSQGGVVGTPHYIAPEVWEAQGTTRQSDIYALGCILYEMLTGKKLFNGKTPPEVMMAHFKTIQLPDSWPAGVPNGVSDVLQVALAMNPVERYSTATEMVEALAGLSSASSDISNQDEPIESMLKKSPQRPPQINPAPPIKPFAPAEPPFPESPSLLKEDPPQVSIDAGRYDHLVSQSNLDSFDADKKDEDKNEDENEDEFDFAAMSAEEIARKRSKKRRGFIAHLGPYLIVNTGLFCMNVVGPIEEPWFMWVTVMWGVGLAFHLLNVGLFDLKTMSFSKKWLAFGEHLGAYSIIITMLFFINMLTGNDPWFLWPAFGWGIAVAIHFWQTLFATKEETDEQAMSKTDQVTHKVRQRLRKTSGSRSVQANVTDSPTQAYSDQAHTYRQQIEKLIKSTSNPHNKARLQELAVQMKDWVASIEALGKRIERFEENEVIRQDLVTVPRAIQKLEAQQADETDPTTRAEIERTLTNRRNQLAALEHLKNTMRRAEIKIESTLSALGTIYSQILTSQSTNHVADYGRLSANMDEEVRTLHDHLEALEEVKFGG